MQTQVKAVIWFLTLLALFSAPHLASAYYDPGVQRWINRDPISERGFYYRVLPEFEYLHGWTRDYTFVLNSPSSHLDARGLYHVCCRLVEYDAGDGCLVWAASHFIYHCDMRPSRTPCDSPNDSSYPVVSDRSSDGTLPDGTSCCKASGQQISSCLKNQKTDGGHGRWGDNCQSSTMNNLKTCCAKSTWSPSPYAYPYDPSFPPMVN
jgi:hypothetical protein